MSVVAKRALICFGTFEVDLESGEIWKSGFRIRLQGQPFRVLAALLAKPGSVVTREELQHEIWGQKTNIDFERGIASAINKVREALGDSAENPIYIETLARRGYRFIAPVVVEEVLAPASESASRSLIAAPPPAEEPGLAEDGGPMTGQVLAPETDSLPSPGRRFFVSTSTHILLAMTTALLIALIGIAMYVLVRPSAPGQPPRILQLTTAGNISDGPPSDEHHMTLVTDGARIYTSFLVDGRTQISSMNLGGTEVQPLSLPEELGSVSIADISGDGSRLIVKGQSSRGSEQPLWIVPTTGGSALRVGAVMAHDATWMPSGDSILFASGNALGTVDLETGAETNYATLPGRAFWPRWSPDGKTLRFTLMDPVLHTSSLWELDAKSRRTHALNFAALPHMNLCCGSWTADGSTFLFEAGTATESNIWSAGKGPNPKLTELTNGPLRFVSPLTARSGRTVYFVGQEQPADERVYDQKSRQFIPAPAYLNGAGKVAFSRDEQWIAWTDPGGHLWRARSKDGTDRLRLTEDDLEVFLAQWSPDGHQLVMMARRPGQTWQIYAVDAAGGPVRQLLADARNLADPDWSSDGRSIVFGRQAELMGKETGPKMIEVLDITTHSVTTLPGSENLFSPRWSPDGRWICALSLDQTRLLLYDVQGGRWRTLFTGTAADPVWSGDSKSIYFHNTAKPGSGIMRVWLNGRAERIADPSTAGLPSDDYRFTGVTPNGSPLIEPGIGTGNLYAVSLAQ